MKLAQEVRVSILKFKQKEIEVQLKCLEKESEVERRFKRVAVGGREVEAALWVCWESAGECGRCGVELRERDFVGHFGCSEFHLLHLDCLAQELTKGGACPACKQLSSA